MKYLIVVDVQNDFIDGALGSPDAVEIVPRVKEKIDKFDGTVLYTRDTHGENYMETQEGSFLPVPHCIKGSAGWEISPELDVKGMVFDKPTFGSRELAEYLSEQEVDSVELIGLDTDICVLSNALLIKAFMPEVPVKVDASCCARSSKENHRQALEAMKICQIII